MTLTTIGMGNATGNASTWASKQKTRTAKEAMRSIIGEFEGVKDTNLLNEGEKRSSCGLSCVDGEERDGKRWGKRK